MKKYYYLTLVLLTVSCKSLHNITHSKHSSSTDVVVECESTTLTDNDYFNLILSLRDNVFESITLSLGDGATNKEIWDKYISHKKKYDSLDNDVVDPTI